MSNTPRMSDEQSKRALLLAVVLILSGCVPVEPLLPLYEKGDIWHPATKAECDAETDRQYKAMAEAGWCCDPPITMGMAMFWSKEGDIRGTSFEPCAYFNQRGEYRGQKQIHVGHKTCKLTNTQEENTWDTITEKNGHQYSQQNYERLNELFEACAAGKLPTLSGGTSSATKEASGNGGSKE